MCFDWNWHGGSAEDGNIEFYDDNNNGNDDKFWLEVIRACYSL